MTRASVPRSRGFFVVLEGIDGSGKTLQTQRLADFLRARGERVLQSREPTDGPFGRRYREWARGEREATPEQVLHFFLDDRREHVANEIAPALASGSIVVCDRYMASTYAYQVAAGIDREQLRAVLAAESVPAPDLTLWLRLPVAQALARLPSESRERFERAEFLQRVDAEYARLELDEIDASRKVDDVARDIASRVLDALAKARTCDA
jgi:dTMP kinase